MTDIAIKATNVAKCFKLYQNMITGPVKEHLFFWKRQEYYEQFWAVKDVSFEIKRGEVVGIIGPNGAGKTTLLKMLAGLLPVEKGNIEINGKVTALLALGVAVHTEFTGKENIYFGGIMLGMTKEEVIRKTPKIVEFAELGDFINRPFRTYSSGMKARLLFAIAMSIDPDILVVDEALATGDTYFVQKSSQRIRELCDSGATIIFVSHNISQVQELCKRVLFIAEGRIMGDGNPSEIISKYYKWVFNKEKDAPIIRDNRKLLLTGGTGEIALTNIELRNEKGEESTGFYSGENMYIELYYQSSLRNTLMLDLFVGFILSNNNQYVGEINTSFYVESLRKTVTETRLEIGQRGMIRLSLKPLLFLNNHYSLWIILYDRLKCFCEYRGVAPFFVSRKAHSVSRGAIFWQPCEISSFVNRTK